MSTSCSRRFALLLTLVWLLPSVAMATSDKLLVVLLDGFRWNYLDKFSPGELPGFTRLLQDAVSPDALVPAFPPLSFVNFYSIMTGLYPESHGMIDNYMYDEKYDTEFLFGRNVDQNQSYWWDDGEPLWITAVRQGKRAYFWYWNGCEAEIRGYRPTFCDPYQTTPNPSFEKFSEGLELAVEVLRNGSADLAGVYLERVDYIGHRYGPESVQMNDTIRTVDAQLVRLQDMLGSESNFTLMLFSDHGMSERVGGAADAARGLINVLNYVSADDWQHATGSTTGPVLLIWPKEGKLDSMYETLRTAHPNMTVYKKEDIPERYHFKNHYRVPPLYLVADEGYAFARNASFRELPNIGYHGYDNELYTNMHGIFIAKGPAFNVNASFGVRRLPNVDVYNLMCHVMQLVASPNNGTWSNVCGVLADNDTCADPPYSSAARPQWTPLIVGCAVILLAAVL